MKPTELIQVKAGIMLNTENVHSKDQYLCDDDIMALPRVVEIGISGAAGFYLLFEYDGLDATIELLSTDIKAAEAIILKYEERNASYLAHPNIDGGSPCCGGYGKNRDEFNDLGWNVDKRVYQCVECDAVVKING